jgi:hypothetical protein
VPLHSGGDSTSEVFVINKVGRCRLTVSKPALKARLASALETNI